MTALRKSAKGQQCQVRIINVCNWNPETVVLAHLNGAGIGRKDSDLFGCYCCSSCHAWLDYGYANAGATKNERDLNHLLAVIATQRIWLAEGKIKIC
jgi:Protein of unknown function (DUF1364)